MTTYLLCPLFSHDTNSLTTWMHFVIKQGRLRNNEHMENQDERTSQLDKGESEQEDETYGKCMLLYKARPNH